MEQTEILFKPKTVFKNVTTPFRYEKEISAPRVKKKHAVWVPHVWSIVLTRTIFKFASALLAFLLPNLQNLSRMKNYLRLYVPIDFPFVIETVT